MNTLHLKYIVEIERTGSITLAAKNLYMNQPNLSKAVKEFEEHIGAEIFKRTTKGIVPTPKGEEILNYARKILSQIDEMEALNRPDRKNRIYFGLAAPRAWYISHALALFVAGADKTKELDINFTETDSTKTIRSLAAGEYDLGIVRYRKDYEGYFTNFLKERGLKYEEIWEFDFLALMSKESPLASKESISGEELGKYIEIVHGDLFSPNHAPADTRKRENSHDMKRRIRMYDKGSQLELLNMERDSYIWVSPLPPRQLEKFGLVQKKGSGSRHKYKDIAIYQERNKECDINRTFIEQLKKVTESIGGSN